MNTLQIIGVIAFFTACGVGLFWALRKKNPPCEMCGSPTKKHMVDIGLPEGHLYEEIVCQNKECGYAY